MQQAVTHESELHPPTAPRRPAPLTRVVLVCGLALAAGVATAALLESARYEKYAAVLHARGRTITAGRDARIAQVLVEPGQHVAPGQTLVVLIDERLDEQIRNRQREVAGLEAELAEAEAKLVVELEWRQKAIQAEVFETKIRSAQFQKRQFSNQVAGYACDDALGELGEPVQSADSRSDSWQPLLRESRIANDQRLALLLRQEAAQNEKEVSSAQVELCDERLKQLDRLGRELPDKIRNSMGIALLQTRLAQNRAELKSLEQQHKTLAIPSDGPGLVGVLQKEAGDLVSPREPIVQLWDEDQPYLVVRVPSLKIAEFTPGTLVTLRFPGNVAGLGRVGSIPPQTAPDARADNGMPVVLVHIEPAGAMWPRPPYGSEVEVLRRR